MDMARGRPDLDWAKMKKEYAQTNMSIRDIANKYKVSRTSVERHYKADGWCKTRKEVKTERVEVTKVIKAQADVTNAELCKRISNLMVTKTVQALEEVDPRNTQGLKHLSGVIKDLKEVRMWKDDLDLDRKEQEARIAKLLKEAEGNDADNTVTINIVGADDYAG